MFSLYLGCLDLGWRDGSEFKSPFSLRGPRFVLQHPHGGSQTSVTPVLGDPALTELHWHQAHVWFTDMHASKALIHIHEN